MDKVRIRVGKWRERGGEEGDLVPSHPLGHSCPEACVLERSTDSLRPRSSDEALQRYFHDPEHFKEVMMLK